MVILLNYYIIKKDDHHISVILVLMSYDMSLVLVNYALRDLIRIINLYAVHIVADRLKRLPYL